MQVPGALDGDAGRFRLGLLLPPPAPPKEPSERQREPGVDHHCATCGGRRSRCPVLLLEKSAQFITAPVPRLTVSVPRNCGCAPSPRSMLKLNGAWVPLCPVRDSKRFKGIGRIPPRQDYRGSGSN